uniref:Uncharacterized protein n=1 Tax=Romanomermis culicivorax TaxID=13658 RepID=A0A915KQI2_ROMCU
RVFRKLRKEILSGILCAVSLLIGFLFVTGPGIYWFDLFDSFTGSFALMAVALLENIAVAYVYGWKKFCNDLLAMTGHYPGKYWSINWRFISPLAMTTIFLSSLAKNFLDPPQYNVYNRESASIIKKPLPVSGQIVAILIVTISILPLPAVLIYRMIKEKIFKQSPIKKAKPSDLKLILEESMVASGSSSTVLMLNQCGRDSQKKSDGTDSGLLSSETSLVANYRSSSFTFT